MSRQINPPGELASSGDCLHLASCILPLATCHLLVVYGRPSLSLDIVEEFRHPLIDRFTLNLFNNELFTEADFRPVEGQGVYLNPEALKKYFRLYEQRMRDTIEVPNKTEPTIIRNLLKDQVEVMSKSIKARETYVPYAMKW